MRNPTLLNSCARAATAAEARFRINGPEPAPRATRVIALDPGAAALVAATAEDRPWHGAHFLTYESSLPMGEGQELTVDAVVRGRTTVDAVLRTADGRESRLSDELDGADVAVMIATADDHAEAALMIGAACARRGIMTAGLVVPNGNGEAGRIDRTVSMLRPYAMVLLVSNDKDDLPEVLAALRA
ncbi:3-methyl-2-oxobutanoate hydroxymethyltransferase [Egicoccus sp. AB-alg6-2]|uniref:3-methyl-2-oxobutanoate hydroxymethyltransferase n=1 Tax=Egicoccus sp. AB-alg6-2 TaxID=3242692 RepID=UPI00359DEE1F